MDYQKLEEIVKDGAALRLRVQLQPAGGPGDKVFPPTYEGGQYAKERRRLNGDTVECVHLDSVQSQANRMELALLEAIRYGRINMPLIEVQFPTDDPLLRDVGTISHLEAPHRIADAIFRDSELNGVRFRETEVGAILNRASLENAGELFQHAPTSLLFGLWDSTGPLGGLGAKFQRAISSEIVAFGVEYGVKTSSRIDPLGITLKAGPIYIKNPQTGEWTLDATQAAGGKKQVVGKDGKPSEVNHGNVTPSVTEVNGGVTFDFAEQMTVLSMAMLRRLKFGDNDDVSSEQNTAARVVLAATGVLAATLSISKGIDLRTRTVLIPESAPTWEAVMQFGDTELLSVDSESAIALYNRAVERAIETGLAYHTEPVVLTPSPGLVELVRRSKEIAIETGE